MAGSIFLKEAAAVTLESSGSALSNNNQVAASTTLDNRSAGNGAQNFWFNFELNGGFGSAPTVGNVLNLYAVPKIDGTNALDVDTTNHVMPPACFVGSFVINKSQTSAQRMGILGVPLQPLLYTLYLDNQSGQQLSATWTLQVVSAEEQYT